MRPGSGSSCRMGSWLDQDLDKYAHGDSRMTLCGVYLVSVDGVPAYVGSSKNIYQRWELHKSDLRRHRHYCLPLQRAWDEGRLVQCELLEDCEESVRTAREQQWIDQLPGLWNQARAARVLTRSHHQKTR